MVRIGVTVSPFRLLQKKPYPMFAKIPALIMVDPQCHDLVLEEIFDEKNIIEVLTMMTTNKQKYDKKCLSPVEPI